MTARHGGVLMVLLVVAVGAMYVLVGSEQVAAGEEIPIYHGITYASVELEPTDESQGFAHLVRVDLSAEGIQPYMTSVDSSLVEHGYQYRLQHPWRVARRERLAVAVNGALFHRSGRWYLPGQRATGTHTVVADGEISHVHPNRYLMWLDGELNPSIHRRTPPPDSVLQQAVWAVGGGEVVLRDGSPRAGTSRTPARRTMIAINSEEKYLWLAVFEHASYAVAAEVLAAAGATDGIMLDGGGSTAMHIGRDAAGGVGGTIFGGWRPVATHIGFHARPLQPEDDR